MPLNLKNQMVLYSNGGIKYMKSYKHVRCLNLFNSSVLVRIYIQYSSCSYMS